MDEMEGSLREEQDKVLANLSKMLPGSSRETLLNPEDVEKAQNEGETIGILKENVGECVSVRKRSVPRKKRKNSCPFTVFRRQRCRRKRNKLFEGNTEENDSGLGTSSEILKCAPTEVTRNSDSEDSVTSMESVSLLQTTYSTAMEVDDVSTGVNLAWNVKIFPPLDDEDDDGGEVETTRADKSVQTVRIPFDSDDSVMRNVNFISSVIRLKQIFSTRTCISREDFAKILKRLPETDELKSPGRSPEELSDDSDAIEVSGEDGLPFIAEKRSRRRRVEMVSCETVRYVMRQTNAEEVTEQSVDSILSWLNGETENNWRTVYYYWDGSVTAEAVDVINEAVDSDVIGIRKKVSDFLAGILNGIHDGDVEDAIAEFKVAFLSNFCKSILLQYDLILQADTKLSKVVPSSSGRGLEAAAAKKIYFTLRLMENLFRSFLTVLNGNGFEEVFRVRSMDTDTGVLNMWRRNWMREEVVADEMENFHLKYVKVIGGWCNRTDEILHFSLSKSPVLSLVAQKCSSLAREILTKVQSAVKK